MLASEASVYVSGRGVGKAPRGRGQNRVSRGFYLPLSSYLEGGRNALRHSGSLVSMRTKAA